MAWRFEYYCERGLSPRSAASCVPLDITLVERTPPGGILD